MNSNDKWQEILDEYGTYEAFLQNHRATHGEMMQVMKKCQVLGRKLYYTS
jgi:hypothetical protein